MKYKVMRVICMFDLPVETDEEKRGYREFRKSLIKEGFIMMQYSVYIRTCPNRDYANRLQRRVQKIAPDKGNVRLLMITEKQYQDMILIIGTKSTSEHVIGVERMRIL